MEAKIIGFMVIANGTSYTLYLLSSKGKRYQAQCGFNFTESAANLGISMIGKPLSEISWDYWFEHTGDEI